MCFVLFLLLFSMRAKRNDSPSAIPYNDEFSRAVERNMDALLAQRREAETQKTSQERIADHITRFSGSMTFVYLHLVGFGL